MDLLLTICSFGATGLMVWVAILLNKIRKYEKITAFDIAFFLILGSITIISWFTALRIVLAK